jgi:hypothetical protein
LDYADEGATYMVLRQKMLGCCCLGSRLGYADDGATYMVLRQKSLGMH